jgi:hypothetical protein
METSTATITVLNITPVHAGRLLASTRKALLLLGLQIIVP